jgi:hypothetical protein
VTAHSHIEFIHPISIDDHRYRRRAERVRAVPSVYIKRAAALFLLAALVFVASPTVRLIAGIATLGIVALLTSVCLWVQNNVR